MLKETLNISESSRVFFTADLHFGHKNIVTYCNRPFTDINEHDIKIIDNWNKVINNDDYVVICGDMCVEKEGYWRHILSLLNGVKYLVLGNHDDYINIPQDLFCKVVDGLLDVIVKDEEIEGGIKHIICSHYPFAIWPGKQESFWHVYGHIHSSNGTFKGAHCLQYDVGVQANDYTPISYEKLKIKITQQCLKKT